MIRRQLVARAESEQQLVDRERLIEGVIEAMPLGVVVFDAEGRPYRSNERSTVMLGAPVPLGESQEAHA